MFNCLLAKEVANLCINIDTSFYAPMHNWKVAHWQDKGGQHVTTQGPRLQSKLVALLVIPWYYQGAPDDTSDDDQWCRHGMIVQQWNEEHQDHVVHHHHN
jgi:hypothetical protein